MKRVLRFCMLVIALCAISALLNPAYAADGEISNTAIIGGGIVGIFAMVVNIVVITFTLLWFFKYDWLKDFVNKKAGVKLLGSRHWGRPELITTGLGALCGLLQWGEALFGSAMQPIMKVIYIVLFIALGVYLWKFYGKMMQFTTRHVALWAVAYKGCLLFCLGITGAVLSAFVIFLLVFSIFLKGIDWVWKDSASHLDPSEDGTGRTKRCESCSSYNSVSNMCTYHGRPMPPTGGCGAI